MLGCAAIRMMALQQKMFSPTQSSPVTQVSQQFALGAMLAGSPGMASSLGIAYGSDLIMNLVLAGKIL